MASKEGRLKDRGTRLVVVTLNLNNKLLFFLCKISFHCVFSCPYCLSFPFGDCIFCLILSVLLFSIHC